MEIHTWMREQDSITKTVRSAKQTQREFMLLKTNILYPRLWKESQSVLVAKLKDPDPCVRWVAAYIIARKRIPAYIEVIPLVSDPVPEIREVAHQTLVRLGRGVDFGPHPLDSQAKVGRAVQRWNEWHLLQESPGVQARDAAPLPRAEREKTEKESP
jgi:hypothetical protein